MIALICLHYLHSPYLSQRAGYDFLWSREIENINFFEFGESNGKKEKKNEKKREEKVFLSIFGKYLVHGKEVRASLLYEPSPSLCCYRKKERKKI